MKVIFNEDALKELYETGTTTESKYKYICKNNRLLEGYQRAVGIMYDVESTADLTKISFLHYEKLKYQTTPKSSVRLVNGLIERLIFIETSDGIEVELLEIDKTHYGKKK